MAYAPIAFTLPQYENYPNWWMKAYEQGTTTPLSIATDATGGTLAAKIELDSDGFPQTAGSVRIIPFINGDYDLWLFPTAAEADANDTTNAIQLADNINADASSSVTPSSIGTDSYVENVAALVLLSPSSGDIYVTKGYYTAGDGGGAKYLVQTAAEFGGTPDSYGDHTLANGNVAVLEKGQTVNSYKYGANAGQSAATNTASIQAAIDALPTGENELYPQLPAQDNWKIKAGGEVLLPSGDINFTSLEVPPQVTLDGVSTLLCRMIKNGSGSGIIRKADGTLFAANDIGLKNFTLVSDGTAGSTGVYFDVCDRAKTKNLVIDGFDVSGFDMRKNQYGLHENLTVVRCGKAVNMRELTGAGVGNGCNNNVFVRPNLMGNATGLEITRGEANWVYGGTIQNNSTRGVTIGSAVVGMCFVGIHFEFHDAIYDVYNEGRNTMMQDCIFVVSTTESERKIYNNSIGMSLINCFTQGTDPVIIRGSKAIITADGGSMTVLGGKYGSGIAIYELAADASDSEAGAMPSVQVSFNAFDGMQVQGQTHNFVPLFSSPSHSTTIRGEGFPRLIERGDGMLTWGDGSSGGDTNLYRLAPDALKTDDAFLVGGNFAHQGSNFGVFNTAATNQQTVTGSKGGNAALTSLLSALAAYGIIVDSST